MGQVFDDAAASRRVLINLLPWFVLQGLTTSSGRPNFVEEGFSSCREKSDRPFLVTQLISGEAASLPKQRVCPPATFQGVAMTVFARWAVSVRSVRELRPNYRRVTVRNGSSRLQCCQHCIAPVPARLRVRWVRDVLASATDLEDGALTATPKHVSSTTIDEKTMKKNKFRFTNRALVQLPVHDAASPSRSAEYSDAGVIGLRVLVTKQGRKYFYFRFVFEGQKRAAKLGEFPALEVPGARKLALEMRAKVDRGINPQEAHDRAQASPTFEAFGAAEYMPFARQTKRSAHDDECRLRVQIYPRFGSRKLADIQTREIQQFHADLKESHCAATANRCLSLISRMYTLACQWTRVDRNPCVGISKWKENNQRQRFLTPDEIQRVYQAMESDPSRTAVAALKFLLLTGARRNEALKAQWENVDLDNGVWYVPLTKAGKGRYVQLNSESQNLLRALPRIQGSPWLFPSRRDPSKPIYSPQGAFDRVLKASGIEHLRLHDLRHTYASLAINAGVSLSIIQGLLHHQSPVQTMRYSHLMNSTLRTASESISDAVSMAIRGKAGSTEEMRRE